MAYCHECGSEVAPNDVYCPYCGISLPPSPVAAADDKSVESVADEKNGSAETPENVRISGATTASAANENDSADDNILNLRPSATDDYSKLETEENWNLKTESVELQFDQPAQSLAPQENAAPKVNSANESNFASFEPHNSADSSAKSAPENIKESAPDGRTANDSNGVDDFSATIPTFSAAPEPHFNSAAKMAGEAENKPSEPLTLDDLPPAKPADEQPLEKGIAKPEDELEISPPVQSVFDSVRIMERSAAEEKAVKNVFESSPAEIIQPSFAAPKAEIAPPSNIAEHDAQKEDRSYTTPNFAKSDTDGKKAAKLKPLDEGTILNNRYEIIRKIGGGGMGAVYLASDNNLGGVLRAVKEMVQSYIGEDQQDKAINDFKRESMILSTLDHTSIPTIYDYFYDDKESRFYLVMKYISGGDLAARLRAAPEGKIDEKSVTEWAIQIADVLDYLHNRPSTIVYRDLKPANVMLDGNTGRVMLIDFGIARSVNKEEKGVTAVGTMGYAPPELFSGNVEPRSDIYSLGSTMFHLLTGADPQSNPLLIFDFQKNPRPRQINSALSDQIEKILMRSVEYNAQSRFASAAEMRRVLEEHLENLKAGRVSYGTKETPASVGLENQPVFCGFCGQRIMASDMFCAFCGSRQPLAQKGVHAAAHTYSAARPATAKLMIMGTNELESPVFNLDKDENLVGRRDPQSNIFPEVDLSKFDPQTKISRRHARVWRQDSNFLVEDLGSSNGTVVIPAISDTIRLLPHQPHVLVNGDKIRLGDTTLHFVIG